MNFLSKNHHDLFTFLTKVGAVRGFEPLPPTLGGMFAYYTSPAGKCIGFFAFYDYETLW